MKHLLVLFILISSVASGQTHSKRRVNTLPPLTVSPSGPDDNYRSITIDASEFSSDVTNFILHIELTENWLKTVGNGGSVQNSNGYDITFSSDADGLTPLNFDSAGYNGSSGHFAADVLLPSASSSVDNVIYIRYNNAAVTTYQGAGAATWPTECSMSFRMNEVITDNDQTLDDRTSNNLNLTTKGATAWTSAQQAAGPYSGSGSLKLIGPQGGNGQYLIFSEQAFDAAYTVDFYAKAPELEGNTLFLSHRSASYNNFNWYASSFHFWSGGPDEIVADIPTSANTWVHITLVRSGTSQILYIDGVQHGTSSNGNNSRVFDAIGNSMTGLTRDIHIGPWQYWRSAWSPAYVAAFHKNRANQSGFLTIGSEN